MGAEGPAAAGDGAPASDSEVRTVLGLEAQPVIANRTAPEISATATCLDRSSTISTEH